MLPPTFFTTTVNNTACPSVNGPLGLILTVVRSAPLAGGGGGPAGGGGVVEGAFTTPVV